MPTRQSGIVWGAEAKPPGKRRNRRLCCVVHVQSKCGKCVMGRGANWSRIASRKRMRRQGVEDIKGATPVVSQRPKRPRRKVSKAELREQAEAAFLAWRFRFGRSGLGGSGLGGFGLGGSGIGGGRNGGGNGGRNGGVMNYASEVFKRVTRRRRPRLCRLLTQAPELEGSQTTKDSHCLPRQVCAHSFNPSLRSYASTFPLRAIRPGHRDPPRLLTSRSRRWMSFANASARSRSCFRCQ